jgi:hypothetical protein
MRALPILLLAVALSIPTTASAAALKPWVGFNGSLGKYSMGDVNRDLEGLNTDLVGTSLHLWPIGGGPGCGVTAGVDVGRGFSFGAGYDRVFASSGVSNPRTYLKVRLPANAFRGTVEYAFPRSGPLGAHIGLAAGRLMATGQSVSDSALDLRGTAPLYEAYLGLDWSGQPRCALFATVGYRYARVKEVKIDGQVKLNPDGTQYRADYSGTLLRLGLKIPLTAPATTQAATPAARIKPWIGLNGSWGSYGIADADFLIERTDDGFGVVRKTHHLGPKKISSGSGFGGSVGLDFPGHVTLGAGYDRLAASSIASNANGSNEYRLPANALRVFVEYRLPARGHFGTRLGLAGGTVMEARSAARDSSSSDGMNRSFPIKGSGALLEVYGSGEWQPTSRVAATASLGYRYAKVYEVQVDRVVYFNPSGTPYTADYSGLIARIGLKVSLTK